MGYIRHHAIIVVGQTDEPHFLDAHELAARLFADLCDVSPVMTSGMNSYATFMIPPDGSKEFRSTSDAGDRARADFRAQLDPEWLTVTEVCLGDEQGEDHIVDEDEGREFRRQAEDIPAGPFR